jgi:uncharacterized protein
MKKTGKIDYIEMPARDIEAAKRFFALAFGWRFIDYGPDYVAFDDAGLDGGFYRAPLSSSAASGGALVILYSDALEATAAAVTHAGGDITKPIFSFPGGRRFHFHDPNGNEWAVWSDLGV